MQRWQRSLRQHRLLGLVLVVLAGYAVALAVWTSGSVDGVAGAAVSVDPVTSAPAGPLPNGSTPDASATAGPQTVTFRATGTSPIGLVGYRIGTRPAVQLRGVAAPFSRSRRALATERLVMTVQVGPGGGHATCVISIDGREQVSQTARGAFNVVACVV